MYMQSTNRAINLNYESESLNGADVDGTMERTQNHFHPVSYNSAIYFPLQAVTLREQFFSSFSHLPYRTAQHDYLTPHISIS